MSLVANIILKTHAGEPDENAQHLNEYFAREYKSQCNAGRPMLVEVGDHCGGIKGFECNLYIGAVNYLMKDKLIEAFRGMRWQWGDCTELMIQGQDDDQFTVYHP